MSNIFDSTSQLAKSTKGFLVMHIHEGQEAECYQQGSVAASGAFVAMFSVRNGCEIVAAKGMGSRMNVILASPLRDKLSQFSLRSGH